MGKLLIFDTHPIQYRSPVFMTLTARHPNTKVFYFDEAFDGRRWWFHEYGKIPEQKWDLELRTGFESTVVGTRALGPWKTFWKLRRILREEKPAQVALYGYYLPEHWMLRVLCGWRHIPLVFIGETYQSGAKSIRRFLKGPLRAYFFAGVSRFITIGEKTRAYYRELGVPEDRMVSAKYCVDLQFFSKTEQDRQTLRAEWRQRFGIPPDAFVTLFVGRLFERKRPQDVIALARHLRGNPGFHTVIVGNGPLETPLRAASVGMERVHWLGFQNQAQTAQAYCGSDVLYVPSEYETWGLVVNEAAACGIASIVTETCGVADDLIVEAETGFIVGVGDVAAAVEAVRILKRDTIFAKHLGREAHRRVTESYTTERFAEAFIRTLAPKEAASG